MAATETGGDETAAMSGNDAPARHRRFASWYEALSLADEVDPDSLRPLDEALADIDRRAGRENSHLVQAFNTRLARPRALT